MANQPLESTILTSNAQQVRGMFASIASRYDRANSVLSLGIHHLWRRALLGMVAPDKNARVLDLCTGTGDLIPPLEDRFGEVVGADFCEPMLAIAREKLARRGSRAVLVQADALELQFESSSFDIVSVAFGVRNFADLRKGLSEIRRVLKPGGRALILEFGQPAHGLFGWSYKIYSKNVMPLIGGLLTGNREAYTYLPATASEFPCGEQFDRLLNDQGFQRVVHKALTGGIAYCYCAY